MYCETADGVIVTEVSSARADATSNANAEQKNEVLRFMIGY
jgi:hypothetical protein